MSSSSQVLPELNDQGLQGWPMEVRALLNSLQKQAYVPKNRRGGSRREYRVQAILWYKDSANQPQQTTVYTRDATAHGVAFLTQQCFKGGQSVILEIPTNGCAPRLQGHIRRCRQFKEGWFECVMQFPPSKKK
jgi:hypothetical protein